MRTLIRGGVASGKSRLALRRALEYPPPRVFVATAEALAEEMAEKIARHRKERGEAFITIEEPLELSRVLRASSGRTTVVDCLTVWLGNLFHYGRKVEEAVEEFLESVSNFTGPLILVSNEVGLSPIAPDPLTRRYVNALGRLNQELSRRCEEVLLVVAGNPLPLKPSPNRP